MKNWQNLIFSTWKHYYLVHATQWKFDTSSNLVHAVNFFFACGFNSEIPHQFGRQQKPPKLRRSASWNQENVKIVKWIVCWVADGLTRRLQYNSSVKKNLNGISKHRKLLLKKNNCNSWEIILSLYILDKLSLLFLSVKDFLWAFFRLTEDFYANKDH